jgi:hypothetical protein
MDTSAEVSQLNQTVSQPTPKKDEVVHLPCERCERRKLRERGYAREARKRKKLAGADDCKKCEEGEVIS